MIRFVLPLIVATLAACTLPNVHPDFAGLSADADPTRFTCCADPERQPLWFANAVRDMGAALEPISSDDGKAGLLAAQPAARARVAAEAQPFDFRNLPRDRSTASLGGALERARPRALSG